VNLSALKPFRTLVLPFLALVTAICGYPAARAQAPQPALAAQAQSAMPPQPPSSQRESVTFPALMVSDIHLDPFHDPAKAQQLAAAPVAQWKAILSAPPSPDQAQAFATLQQTCHARGVDTPFPLFESSLQAMRARQPDASFITISGDLIAHGFSCRFATLLPSSPQAAYQAFVLKTLSFVMSELRTVFPGAPIYAALGNNDTGCGDYKLDAGSDFLAQTGKIVAEGLPPAQREAAAIQFAVGGYYSVALPEPMHGSRLIVLNDLLLSPSYSTCAGKPDPAPADAEMAWLEQQLSKAREAGEQVWVMAHIPPGIDPYSTVAKFRDVCSGKQPVMFLAQDKLADLIADYADVIRLGIFAHTHMDELRLATSEAAGPPAVDPPASATHQTAIKLVPSISPVNGNNPSFTVARIDPSTAGLRDYEVIAASNQTGIDTKWATEYDYAKTYHEHEFSPATVSALIAGFKADSTAKSAASQAYIRDYFIGDRSSELTPFWPLYVCALDHLTAKAFAACVCSTPKP
jgi:sphingomyelin phosphodiesterase acid-like 3